MALDADPCRQDQGRVADADRSVGGDDGALRTTTTHQSGLEGQDIVDTEHLGDVRARRGLAVHAERERADPDLGARGKGGDAGETMGRYLLAQVAGMQTEGVVC